MKINLIVYNELKLHELGPKFLGDQFLESKFPLLNKKMLYMKTPEAYRTGMWVLKHWHLFRYLKQPSAPRFQPFVMFHKKSASIVWVVFRSNTVSKRIPSPETNIFAPKNGCLEYRTSFLLGPFWPIFRCYVVCSFQGRVGFSTTPQNPEAKTPTHVGRRRMNADPKNGTFGALALQSLRRWDFQLRLAPSERPGFGLTVHHGCWGLKKVQKGWKTNEMYTKVWQFLVSVVFFLCKLWKQSFQT